MIWFITDHFRGFLASESDEHKPVLEDKLRFPLRNYEVIGGQGHQAQLPVFLVYAPERGKIHSLHAMRRSLRTYLSRKFIKAYFHKFLDKKTYPGLDTRMRFLSE